MIETSQSQAEFLDRITELQPFPAAAVALIEAVSEDDAEVADLERLVGTDPALTAEVLRAANNALRRGVVPIETIKGGIMALGSKGMAELALTFLCGRYLLGDVPLPKIASVIWRHSLAVAGVSTELSARHGAHRGLCRTLALLHEIGRLAAVRVVPERVAAVNESIEQGMPLAEAEYQHLGVSGEALTATVASIIGLPDPVVQNLAKLEKEDYSKVEVKVVHAADRLVPLLGYPIYHGMLAAPLGSDLEELIDGSDDFARSISRVADDAARLGDSEAGSGVGEISVSPDMAFDALLRANRRLATLNRNYELTRLELEGRIDETRRLADTLAAITMGLDDSALRYSILESLLENYKVDVTFLVTSEDGGGLMEGVAFRMEDGADFGPLEIDLANLAQSTRQAFMRGMSVTLEDASEEPGMFEAIGEYGSMRVTPLMVRGRCNGLLGVGLKEAGPTTPVREEYLEIIGGAAALGLDNASLYQDLLREVARDVLTGVATRRVILQELESHCEEGAGPLAVLLVDLDNFKNVNDTLGHQEGDRYLRDVAKSMSTVLSSRGRIGRYGGDEFIVIAPGLSLGEARTLGEKLRVKLSRVAAAGRWSEVPGRLGASVGIGWSAGGKVCADEMVARADSSLYEAKQGGRDRVGAPMSDSVRV